ncbi:response regulator [Corallincola spongiicola]|uniref:histidine kinase n=1 Tax=Corallincola spongiicola TaxID=2520508 RepID=A0ABY1WR19_9GAMM|nr:response regulator [Corallincola spongiicola]TAA47161.1 PAS domain-containing sensor histidine kinase [Corallincola spongiicola]
MSSLFRTARSVYLVTAFFILLVSVTVWRLTEHNIQISKQQQVASLQTVLRITHQALLSWYEQQVNTLTAMINNPIYRPLANQLDLLPAEPELLRASPAHLTLSMQIMPMLTRMRYTGYQLIDRDGLVLSSNELDAIGQATPMLAQSELVSRLWRGEALISLPLKTRGDNLSYHQYVATPLFDGADQPFAALLIQQDAEQGLGQILQRARQGKSGEAFAFTSDGLMLSNSRFEKQLRALGLLDADQRSALNLKLADPGRALTVKQKAAVGANQPLTFLVQQALKQEQGIDVDGYRDYRGVEVVGAWQWDDKLGFGIAVEMDATEAFTLSRQGIFSAIGWTVLLATGTLAFAIIMIRHRRRFQKQDRLLTELINRAPIQLSIKDLEGRYLLVNDALASRYGRDKKNIVGGTVEQFLSLPEARLVRKHDQEVLDTTQVQLFEETFHLADEQEVLRTIRFPLLDLEGRIEALCAIAIDVTEEASLREALRQLNDELEQRVAQRTLEAIQANKAKSEFLANMSHEIRTPMNAVLGMVQLLLNTPLTAQQKDYVDKAQLSAKSLLQIINDILDFSKIEAGKLALEKIEFSLDKVLDQAVSLTSHKLVGKNVELLLALDPDVPTQLLGDPLRLTQVLTNLLSNASKFTPHGEITLQVRCIEEQRGNANLEFKVIDSGIGIEAERLESLFSPFEQADGSTTRQFGGTGLGLSICKRLVELMGGDISVNSDVGKGTSFSFCLNFVTLEKDAPISLSRALQGKLALVVDDSAGARNIYANMLQSFGVEVVEAQDGEVALAEIMKRARANTPFQLLLVDWKMPKMDGLQLLDHLLEMQHENPVFAMPRVLMMTAFGYEDDFARQHHMLSSRTLYKPFTPSALFDQLCELFQVQPLVDEHQGECYIDLTGCRLLLVEDNPINQQVAAELLLSRGADVSIASSGVQALSMQAKEQFDLILMDIQMPEMDGLEAARQLRDRGVDTPIIAMTAHAMNEDKEKSLAAGMNDHVTKPIDADHLFSVIAHWLGLSQSQEKQQQESQIFNGDFALRQCSDNKVLLGNSLRSFVGEAAKSMEAIAEFHRNRQGEELVALLHRLKGSAGNLGMQPLSASLAQGQQLCEQSNYDDEYEGWVTDFRALFQQTIQSVKSYLDDNADPVSRIVPVPRDALLGRLEALRVRIQDGEYIDDQEIARLKASFRAGEDSALFEQLSLSLISLDQEAALNYLSQLLELLRARYR